MAVPGEAYAHNMSVEATAEELERLLEAAAQDPAERPAFAQALLGSQVFVPGWLDESASAGVARAGTHMRLYTWVDGDGPFTPFFTSQAALESALSVRPGTNGRFLKLRTRDLFEFTSGQRLILNPGGRYGKVYLPREVELMLAGKELGGTVHVQTEKRTVLVGAAAHLPQKLPEVLARFFVQRQAVEAAHLGWIVHPDGHKGYLLVVVADDREAAMAGFGYLQIARATNGETMDVMVVPENTRDHLLASVAPFYVRQP